METKKKKNRIILCICSIFILVASIFSFIPVNKETNKVYANEVYNNAYFRGSPVTFTSSMYEYYYTSNGALSAKYGGLNSYEIATQFSSDYSVYFQFLYTVFGVHMRYNAYGVVEFLPIFQYPQIIDGEGFVSNEGEMKLFDYSFLNTVRDNFSDTTHYPTGAYDQTGGLSGKWFAIDGSNGLYPYNSDNRPRSSLITMDMSSYNGGFWTSTNQHLSGIVFRYFVSENPIKIEKINRVNFSGGSVKYLDVDGNWISFMILSDNYLFHDNTYYFANNLFTDNEYYTAGYDSGYDNGYLEGEIKGQDSGYTSGYQSGKNDGYNLGYNQALENGQKYTFTALISSVIDVPVKAFTSLFNFEILGVNLSGFFLGLLTCCIVIGVIRLIL